ncbi:MAG: hypothetical protein ABSG76_16360, partial [Xanthobacteraceae bacterium]
LGAAAVGSVLIATGASATAGHRHGRSVGYAGPALSAPPAGYLVPIQQPAYRSWPEGSPGYHGANGG